MKTVFGPLSSHPSVLNVTCVLLVLASIVALAAPGCGGGDTSATSGPPSCSLSSDCLTGLVCAIGRCRPQCQTDVDCNSLGAGATCVFGTDKAGTKGFYCQAPADKNKPCSKPSECTAPMACATDYRCRNLCTTNADCNTAGVTNKVCAQDANNVDYCASPMDVTVNAMGNQVISATPPAGAMTSSTVTEPPDASMVMIAAPEGGLPEAAMPGMPDATMMGMPDAMMGMGDSTMMGMPDGAMGMPDAGPPEASPAADGAKSCGACPNGTACDTTTGQCGACGSDQQLCCPGNPCLANLVCNMANNQCECGNVNQPCCGGSGGTCNNNITCLASDAGAAATCTCGQIATACCPVAGGGAATCAGQGACAGKICGCVLEYAPVNGGGEAIVRLVDGTLRKVYDSDQANSAKNGHYQPVVSGAGPLRVGTAPSSIAVSGSGSTYGPIGCAIVKDGSVWCFPLKSDTLTDSSYMGAGGGPTQPASLAQQVWSSVDGSTKLSGIVQLAGGTSSYPSFCAVDTAGSVWCWGYNGNGQLGTGDTSQAVLYASQVKTGLTTTFTGAAEVRIGYEATCARMKAPDGSIWCWGSNSQAELGVSSATTFTNNSNYYPNKISIAGQSIATKLVVGPWQTFCAVMTDTSAVTTALCWGYNASGAAGLPPAGNPNVPMPTTILQAAGGNPLPGVADIVDDGAYSMCARLTSANNPIVCWGSEASSMPYPVARKDNSNFAITGINGPLAGGYYSGGLSYVNRDSLVSAGGNSNVPQPTCDGLIPPGQ